MTQRKFACGKCGIKPKKWDREPETEYADVSCPRCGKKHLHIQTQIQDKYVPVDEGEEEPQNIFITPVGRKIHGIDRVQTFLQQISDQKFCKNCGTRKTEGWRYNSGNSYDIECPECSQKHKEELNKLIPVDDTGEMLPVVTDPEGETYFGEDVQDGLNKLKDTRGESS